jgi:hypothetical protein
MDFGFNFENFWFVYLILFLTLLLFLLVLHKYYNIFNLLDVKKTVPVIEKEETETEIEMDIDNDADIDSDVESNESDPLHITLRAAEMYYDRGDTEKAMELWNTIVIKPITETPELQKTLEIQVLEDELQKTPVQKTLEDELQKTPVQKTPVEPQVQKTPKDSFLNKESGLFTFPVKLDLDIKTRDWKTDPALNAYIQILMKNIKDNPKQSNIIIRDAKTFIEKNFSEYTLPVIFSNVITN